jgi:hypothetical protein
MGLDKKLSQLMDYPLPTSVTASPPPPQKVLSNHVTSDRGSVAKWQFPPCLVGKRLFLEEKIKTFVDADIRSKESDGDTSRELRMWISSLMCT